MKNKHKRILDHLGIKEGSILGKGMEGCVYQLTSSQVVKIWEAEFVNQEHLLERKKLLDLVADQLTIPIPEIYEIGKQAGVIYTIEKRLSGNTGNKVYVQLEEVGKNELLDNYFNILQELNSVSIVGRYGQLLSSSAGKIQTETWTEFLVVKLSETLKKISARRDHDIQDVEKLFERFKKEEIPKLNLHPKKSLVHGDLFFENVLVGEDLRVSGLLDFSSLSVVGDHLMDVAALCYFARVSEGIGEDEEAYLLKMAMEMYPGSKDVLHSYLVYFSLLFVNSQTYDPRTYSWCINSLKRLDYL